MKTKCKILQSLMDKWVQNTIILCTIFIVALIFSLCQKMSFQINKPNTYYYFFCTIAQVYGAFLAILLTGLIFRINNIDSVFEDLTNLILEAIGEDNYKYKNPLKLDDIYNNLKKLGLSDAKVVQL